MLPNTLTALKKSYIVSTLHAAVCVISVVNFFAKYSVNFTQINRIDGGGVYGTGDEIMAYSIAYSLGYFIYDLLLMLREESVRTQSALVHHIIVLMGLTSGLLTQKISLNQIIFAYRYNKWNLSYMPFLFTSGRIVYNSIESQSNLP